MHENMKYRRIPRLLMLCKLWLGMFLSYLRKILLLLFDNLTAQDSLLGYVHNFLIEAKYCFPLEGSATELEIHRNL